MLAQLAAERQPPCWTPPESVDHELHQRLVVRDGLLELRQQARNQRHALTQWPVRIAGALEVLDVGTVNVALCASAEAAAASVGLCPSRVSRARACVDTVGTPGCAPPYIWQP